MDCTAATVQHCNVDESTDEALINILLDNDCLAEILSYLTPMQILQTPLVCKKWQTASFLAWKNIKAFYWQRCLYEEKCLISILSKCGNYLEYMTLKGVDNGCAPLVEPDQYDIFPIIRQYCSNLTYLSITFQICARRCDLIDLLLNVKKLKYIKLHRGADCELMKDPLQVYESMLSVIPKDIEEIHCSLNKDILVPSKSIVASLAEFTAIRCLSLERWKLDRSIIKMITQKYQPLTYLNLDGCEINYDDLLSKLIHRMSHTCKVLKLPLSNNHPNNFEFLTKFEMLESLEVTDPNDDVIMSISNYCENIKNLKMVSKSQTITRNSLKSLEKLKNLESLHLQVELIDDSFLERLIEAGILNVDDSQLKTSTDFQSKLHL
ncbi:hypothetical protein HCN44_009577 [Aphidius gifuensis]|uniref:F-box domain-containing protein n=1 Tax=Aphidius gifuensis TaxID=684658 RepID=A0A835CWB4_APHGI|nr:hypothetical protein HCN44_009577 [Aphidius gifuensis]